MSLAERRWLRLFTLCVLYVAQGIPWGFMAITLPAYLAERGLEAGAVGSALAMTTLPYSFKWVWGPLIDAFTLRRFGRRRPWILLAQGMMVVTVAALVVIPDLTADLDLLMWMVLIHTVFNSMQDVAVDALAVDLLTEDERGKANGLMYAAKYGGGILGGAGMATAIAAIGLRAALLAQVGILVAIMLVPLFVRERDDVTPPSPPLAEVLRSLMRAFTLRSTIACGVLMLGSNLAIGLLTALGNVLFTQHLGWSDTDYAQMVGGPGLALGLGGSVLGGFLADRVGHRRLAALSSVLLAATWAGFAAGEAWWTDRAFVYGLFLVQGVLQALWSVSLYALCMDVAWPRVGATQFTAYMALANLSTTQGYKLVGPAFETWTFAGIYLVAAGVQLAVTAVLAAIDPHQTRRVLDGEERLPRADLRGHAG